MHIEVNEPREYRVRALKSRFIVFQRREVQQGKLGKWRID